MKLPVPVNIITGDLGTGKTTLIAQLLQHARPPGERWAVLINEFGALGIDGALVQADAPGDGAGPEAAGSAAAARSGGGGGGSVVIRELAGGCMCCALSGPMSAAIATLVR